MGTLTEIILTLTQLVYATVPVLVALALLFFFWGMAQWILNMADTEKHKEGKQRMIWGLVALFVIGSVGGLILILQNTFFGTAAQYGNSNFGNIDGTNVSSENILNPLDGSRFDDIPSGGEPPIDGGIGDSFRIIGGGSTETASQPPPTRFEPYNIQTWGCLFRNCSRTRH